MTGGSNPLLYEYIKSHEEALPYMFLGALVVFVGIHWLLERKVDKSIPYKRPKPIFYSQMGLVTLVIILSFFFIETNFALASLIITSGGAIINGLASFVEGLYVAVNARETKRQQSLYFDAAFSLMFGFAVLWLTGSWMKM